MKMSIRITGYAEGANTPEMLFVSLVNFVAIACRVPGLRWRIFFLVRRIPVHIVLADPYLLTVLHPDSSHWPLRPHLFQFIRGLFANNARDSAELELYLKHI